MPDGFRGKATFGRKDADIFGKPAGKRACARTIRRSSVRLALGHIQSGASRKTAPAKGLTMLRQGAPAATRPLLQSQ
jgi:hypothetical protein